jgi:surface antigen
VSQHLFGDPAVDHTHPTATPGSSTRRLFLQGSVAVAAGVILSPLAGMAGVVSAANDYPWQDRTKYPSGYSPLRFYYRNCTDFTAWRLNKQMGATAAPWKFVWGTLFNYAGSDGNARGWKAAAVRAGYRADDKPALGAVAWWGPTTTNSYGHVGIVTKVYSDNRVDVESYNGIGETWYPQTGVRAQSYLHIKDIASGSTTASSTLTQYAGRLVKWSGETPSPVTTWLVGPDLRRTWVPDGATYNWMKAAGASGPTLLSSTVLNALPDRYGVKATADQLGVGWNAPRGTKIWSTKNGYLATFQTDGNFVVYAPGSKAVFASRTSNVGNQLRMQTDGNLVIYDSSGRPRWWTGTDGRGRSRLVMQADGNLVIYEAGGRATWATNTSGGANQLARPNGYRL